jgi:thiol-disulfide isomerase/thioredoxin
LLVPIVYAGLWILIAAVGLAGLVAAGKVWRDGRFRGTTTAAPEPAGERLTSADLDGAALGERATLVHFSSAFCAPCRATRQVLAQVSEAVDGVESVEVDAESHLDLVRRLRIARTPTVLVLDPTGLVRNRATGLPRRADVLAVISAFPDNETASHDADHPRRSR